MLTVVREVTVVIAVTRDVAPSSLADIYCFGETCCVDERLKIT